MIDKIKTRRSDPDRESSTSGVLHPHSDNLDGTRTCSILRAIGGQKAELLWQSEGCREVVVDKLAGIGRLIVKLRTATQETYPWNDEVLRK
jgi:hypothetical protein